MCAQQYVYTYYTFAELVTHLQGLVNMYAECLSKAGQQTRQIRAKSISYGFGAANAVSRESTPKLQGVYAPKPYGLLIV